MHYNFHFLSQEELEQLYIIESCKLQSGINLGLPHNDLRCRELNLDLIGEHLEKKRKKPYALFS